MVYLTGMLGIDLYENHPATTTKMIYEVENGNHSSAEFPQMGPITNLPLNWLKYHLMDSLEICSDLLGEEPENASVFNSTLECIAGGTETCILGDVYVSEGNNSSDPEDYIEIYNSGDYDCSLEGFQLDDNEELDDLTFGTVIIPAGGYWLGYEDEDGSFSSGLSSNGDIIVFADSSGNSLIVELEASTELDSVSLSQSFDENGNGCFTNPTPGISNSECITLTSKTLHSLASEFMLSQNYPNPFNPVTNISYTLSQDSYVNINIYDLKGNYIKSLIRKSMSTGRHSIQWDATNEFGDDVSTGIYFYTIKTEYSSETKKMLFVK